MRGTPPVRGRAFPSSETSRSCSLMQPRSRLANATSTRISTIRSPAIRTAIEEQIAVRLCEFVEGRTTPVDGCRRCWFHPSIVGLEASRYRYCEVLSMIVGLRSDPFNQAFNFLRSRRHRRPWHYFPRERSSHQIDSGQARPRYRMKIPERSHVSTSVAQIRY